MAAAVNVGAGTGEKAGAATSVCGMRNTFNQFNWFCKIDKTCDRATRRAFICLICAPMSVAYGTHGPP
jgi:hypothetical protein